jgi:hypothetical protein
MTFLRPRRKNSRIFRILNGRLTIDSGGVAVS